MPNISKVASQTSYCPKNSKPRATAKNLLTVALSYASFLSDNV